MVTTQDELEFVTDEPEAPLNGASPDPDKGYLDTARGVYVTRSGVELELVKVPYLILERLLNDKSDKPKAPVVEVMVAGKSKRRESNPNDPAFIQALAEWEAEHQFRIFRYLFAKGVRCAVPSEFAKEHLEFFPGASETFIQYLWVCTLLEDDENEIAALADAIMGQTMPTTSGLEASADRFPGTGQRVSD